MLYRRDVRSVSSSVIISAHTESSQSLHISPRAPRTRRLLVDKHDRNIFSHHGVVLWIQMACISYVALTLKLHAYEPLSEYPRRASSFWIAVW